MVKKGLISWRNTALPLAFAMATGCASVPPEVVVLSHTVGQDVLEIQRSYDALVSARFDALRQERLDYLNNEWTPLFLKNWVKSGRLIETAKGEVVYSDAAGDFVAPDALIAEQQRFDTILMWSEAAVAQIEAKRVELIEPLNRQEAAIRAEMNAAFNQVIRNNALVTAHLSSIRKVDAAQSEALGRVGAEDGVRQLNQSILDVSEWASKGLEEIRRANEFLD